RKTLTILCQTVRELGEALGPSKSDIRTLPAQQKRRSRVAACACQPGDANVAVGHGDCIHLGRAQIGEVTSSTRSPILGKNIALARIDVAHADVGTQVEIGKLDGHQKRLPA
ncbi:hypothetical protein EN811_28735, partial [bacterium M00.F.Ca.ET.168.01.1.1]